MVERQIFGTAVLSRQPQARPREVRKGVAQVEVELTAASAAHEKRGRDNPTIVTLLIFVTAVLKCMHPAVSLAFEICNLLLAIGFLMLFIIRLIRIRRLSQTPRYLRTHESDSRFIPRLPQHLCCRVCGQQLDANCAPARYGPRQAVSRRLLLAVSDHRNLH